MKLLSTALSHVASTAGQLSEQRDSYTGVAFNLGYEVTHYDLDLPTALSPTFCKVKRCCISGC